MGAGQRGLDLGQYAFEISQHVVIPEAQHTIARRLGDTARPQVELDYLERLLKDY